MLRTPARLIGRDIELERLTSVIDAAASGRAAFVLLLGEAGIGKSALLAATAGIAAERGFRVLAGSAVETGGTIPYLPLVGPLSVAVGGGAANDPASATVRSVVRGGPAVGAESSAADGEDVAASAGEGATASAGEDAASAGEDAASAGQDAASAGAARFIESVFDVLVRQPTLLIVDDVHWADRSTVTVLDYLARRADAVPLVIVAAARDDEPDLMAALPIADGRRFAQVELHRLDRAEVADQVAALLGRRPIATVVDRVFQRSAGNPLFVEELLGADDLDGAVGASPPTSGALRALVLGRVGRLPSPARSAVEALAIIGRPADEQLVGAVAGLDDETAATALDDAIRGGVATTAGDRFDVRHPIVGEVVAGSLSAAVARRLHRRAADALDELMAPATAGERARHWAAAGDDRRAWTAYLDAASEASHSFAFAELAATLRRAIDLWPAGEPGLARAMTRAAEAAWMSGDAEGALELALSAEARAPEANAADAKDGSDDRELPLELDIAIGRYAWDAGERERSTLAFARAGERLADGVSPALRARALWGIGRARIGMGHPDEACALAVASAEAAREVGALGWEAEAWNLAGIARAWNAEDGTAELERALGIALESGEPGAIGHANVFLVDLLALHGRHAEALVLAERGIATAERLGVAATHGSDLRGIAALLLAEAGRWAEVDAVVGPADPRALPSLARAVVATRRGDVVAADEALAATELGGSIGGRGLRGGPLELARAELAWLRGDREAAVREIQAVTFSPGIWGKDFAAWRALWRARLGVDDGTGARPRHPSTAVDRALDAEVEAETAGDDVARWGRAADAWSALGWPWHVAFSRLRQAEAGFAARDRDAARAALDEALRIGDELGSQPIRDRGEDLARRSRVVARPTRRAVADPSELTARERDVLGLLAEGRTNRQIAESLFLSAKTVEIHVSRILDKLNASTRGEAVAIARRTGQLAGAD